MKKHYSSLLCLFVVLSSFVLSCGCGSDACSGDSKKPEDANRCKITVAATTGGKVKITEYLETTECVPVDSRIEVVATSDEGYAFTGWYVGNATEPVSTDAIFTFVATKNTTLTAHFTKLSNLTICSAGNGWVSFKDEAEVMLDVEIVHEEEPLSGGVPELAEHSEPEPGPEAEAAPQEPEDSPEENVEPLPAESSSEETQTVAPDEKPICPLTPEPSVNPVELDKTVDDVVERVTKFKKKVAPMVDEKKKKVAEQKNKQKQTKKENQVKKESDAVAEALKKSGDKTAAKTSSKSSSKSKSSSSAPANPGLPDFALTDRKLVGKLEKPKYVGDEDGRIVVDICVNADGYVTKASCNRKESNISDPKLRKEAEKAAMKTRFSEAVNNKNDQWGTITYNFTKKYE